MVAVASAGAPAGASASAMDKASMLSLHQNRLQKFVLSWDYVRILAESKGNPKKRKKGDTIATGLKKVPFAFKDVDEYLEVFEPLLFEEVKSQICRGDEDGGAIDWEKIVVLKCEQAHEFYFSQIAVPENLSSLTDNDLVLLTKEEFKEGLPVPSTYAFASIEGREGKQILKLRLFLEAQYTGLNEKSLCRCPRLSKMKTAIQVPQSVWHLKKMSNLSTIVREYAALQSIRHLPFADVILSGKVKTSNSIDSTANIAPSKLMGYLEENHNDSQLEAIKSGLARSPVVLIQGPPGTGKTQTILGLLSVILHATPARVPSKGGDWLLQAKGEITFEEKFDHWLKASPWLSASGNPRDLTMPMDGDDGFFPTSRNEFRPEVVSAKRKHRVHVLVCAPSNAALDEIVLRLMNNGLRDENGQTFIPSIVRIGVNPHHSIQSVSMDYLVEQRLSSMDKGVSSAGPRAGSAGMERERMRLAILSEAAIVCSTLSFSGSGVFQRMSRGFDVVVIDEAAQAVEPSTLVPLAHGCKQVFLVGDPLQLPATVISSTAIEHGYSMSLFKRFQQAGYPVQMLKTQYRMHPQIREFPSSEFYEEALEDGRDVESQTTRPWHAHRCFGPFSFFDIDGQETQAGGSGSLVNNEEVEFVLVLYRHLVARFPQLKNGQQVAVISPYSQQVKVFRERFRDVLGAEANRLVDVNTVDGFQGREKDVAIFSCVRANNQGSIGFLSDFRRMNVALTRARASMLVVGSSSTLMHDKHWGNLVTSARERKRIFKVKKPYHNLFTDESFAYMKKLDEEEKEELKRKLAEGKVDEKKPAKKQAPLDIEVKVEDDEEDEMVEAEENTRDLDEEAED